MSSLGLSVAVTETGIAAPAFADILAGMQDNVRAIYGSDIYIEPDSKDGQLIALIAQAISDCNDAAIATYAQFSPGSAVGVGLSSNVKMNGIARLVSSFSSSVGNVIGQAGSVINNGVVKDENGNLWNLPAVVTIPPGGLISVTVTAQESGAITAPAGTIDKIATPTLGWQSFVSTVDATVGAPVESDAALRKRQTVSTALPAQTPLGSLQGAIANISGVTRVKAYENTGTTTDGSGLPAKSICMVVQGGNVASIAQTIGQKKTPGAATYGTTSQTYTDPKTGIVYTISFFVLQFTTVKIKIVGTALTGYTTSTGTAIQQALSDYIGTHDIGEDIEYSGLWSPAYQNQPARVQPYRVDTLQVSTDGGTTWTTSDVVIAFNKIATCLPSDVTVTIT